LKSRNNLKIIETIMHNKSAAIKNSKGMGIGLATV
jgi:hypothetical protein